MMGLGPTSTLLGVAIRDVVSGCTEPQMVRANTSGRIASVQYPEVVGDRSEVKFPRGAMSRELSTVILQRAVSPSISSALPQPAAFGLVDSSPESFGKCAAASFAGALPATELPSGSATRECSSQKRNAAELTGTYLRRKLTVRHGITSCGATPPDALTSRGHLSVCIVRQLVAA